MSKITVISLGPGPREHLTLGALSALEKAEKVVLRTEKCDAAAYIREKGISFDTLDHLHETCDDFEELAENAAREITHSMICEENYTNLVTVVLK